MIEQAIVGVTDTAEQAMGIAFDAARQAGGLAGSVSERVHESRRLRRQARRQARKGHVVPRMAVLVGLVGLAALAYYLRRRAQRDEMFEPGMAPDAFGAAVIEERASSNGGQPVATPGA